MDLIKEKSSPSTSSSTESGHNEPYSKVGILSFQCDAKGGIVSCNVTVEEKLGYDEKEIVGKNFLTLFSEKNRVHLRKIMDGCLVRGYVKDIDIPMRQKGGRILWVRLSGLTENDPSGNPISIRFYAQDITDFIRAKKQKNLSLRIASLQRGKSEFQQSVEDILVGIQETMQCDVIGIVRNKNLRDWIWKGLREGTDFVAKMWTTETWNTLLEVCQSTEAGHFTPQGGFWTGSISDLISQLPSGKERDCFVSLAEFESLVVISSHDGRVRSAHLVMIHKTAEEWSEEDVKFLEAIVPVLAKPEDEKHSGTFSLNKKMLSMMDIPILGILLVRSGIIQFANGWVEKFLGLPQEEIRGRTMLDFFDPEYHKQISALSENVHVEENLHRRCEAIVLAKDGKRKGIECAFIHLPKDGKTVELWYWIDKEDRQSLRDQLVQARKMESLGMLAGGIVHEFNNLLASILGYSSLLKEEIPDKSPYYDDIQQINRTAERAAELTSRLMAHAEGGEYIVHDLNVNQLIKEVAAILSKALNKNISIRADLEKELWPMRADVSQIQQAILQVALNARDAMTDGGIILFKSRNIFLRKDDARLRFGGKTGRYIQIAINDTGLGMSGQVKERIFEPYFTTKNKTAGKGLGLSMVDEIVENHGGFISVFSEKDKGTVFKIHFPVHEESDSESQSISGEKLTLGKETILLVDDERVLRETARKMLTRYGYKVMSAESGIEAIAMYRKYARRIDLIILDLIMPGMEIDKVLNRIKQFNPKAKILGASELGIDGGLRDDLEQSVSGFIQKPFQVRPLLRTVRSVLNS